MNRTMTTIIGPADHGRRMSLDEFERAEGREGYRYELSRGVMSVVDVPDPRHLAQVNAIRLPVARFMMLSHPGRIHPDRRRRRVQDADRGAWSRSVIPTWPSTKRLRPESETPTIWSQWIPEIVIEVVSPSSRHRDYEEKPEEYLRLGILEYWIVDADEREVLILRRSRGRWAGSKVRPPNLYRSRLLPGFEFACGLVFEAADR